MPITIGRVHGHYQHAGSHQTETIRWLPTVAILMPLALSLLCAPLAVEAQLPSKVARVGFLQVTSPRSASFVQAFEQGLRDLGYVEGQNLVIEFRTAEGNVEQLPALAAELVQRNVDVLVVGGPEVTLRAAGQATSTIPIVMVAVDYDPIALGYIAGLPRREHSVIFTLSVAAVDAPDHRVGHLVLSVLSPSALWRTEGRWQYVDRRENCGKHRVRFLPEKPVAPGCFCDTHRQEHGVSHLSS